MDFANYGKITSFAHEFRKLRENNMHAKISSFKVSEFVKNAK